MNHDMFADRLFNAMDRVDPEPGMLLVAAPGSLEPNFNRSVILVIEHNDVLTFGVNLTRRSTLAVQNILPEWVDITAKPQAIYVGGPLGHDAVVCVGVTKNGVDISRHPYLTRLANRMAVVNLNADPEAVQEAVDGVRLFGGYAEWAPGQLEDEIERGDWYVAPALPSDIVAPGNVDLWGDVMKRQAMPLPLYSTYPAFVESN